MSARLTRPVLGALGALSLAAALSACGGMGSSDEGETTGGEETTVEETTAAEEETTAEETTTAAEDSTDTGAVEGVPTAEVGDCFNTADIGTEIPTVDCTEEHDAQVFFKFAMEDAAEFPGEEAVGAAVAECETEFESFVGTPLADSALDYDALTPTEQTWEIGDREIICVTFNADGTPVTESFEGSGL